MNVLFVLYGDFGGNSAAPLLHYARGLARRGHRCAVVVASLLGATPTSEELECGATPFAQALASPQALFADGRPADVLLAWTPRENVRGFVTDWQSRSPTPWVIYLEDNEDWIARQALSMVGLHEGILLQHSEDVISAWTSPGLPHVLHYRDFVGLADVAVVIQDKLRSEVPPWVPCATVHPSVDLEAFRPMPRDAALRERLGISPNERIIVYPGGLNDFTRPGIETLCRAVHRINERGTACRLVRTGPVALDFLNRLPVGAASRVTELGVLSRGELPALLALADVLVQPGKNDPFDDLRLPGKLPEFFASGRPVVLPAANIATLLRDGVDAVLLDSGTPDEIADKCLTLFADPDLAQRIGEAGRRFAETHFDPARQSAALEQACLRAVEAFDASRAAVLWPREGGAEPTALRLARKLRLLAEVETLRAPDAGHLLHALAAAREMAHTREKALETGLAVRDADLERLRAELAVRDGHISALQRETAIRDEAIQALREESVRRQAHVGAIESSLSWRITSPLRALVRVLRGR